MNAKLILGLAFGLASALIWGGHAVVARPVLADGSFGSFDLAAFRYGVGMMALMPFAWAARVTLLRLGLRRVLLLALFGGLPNLLLFLVALVYAPASHGGTIAPMGLKKALRAQELARENKLPLVALVESGGANLMYQAEIFVDGGRTFANQARLSAAGIPTIALVFGNSTAGGAYVPAMSDEVVIVKNKGTIFLGGPPLVQAATGEVVTDEELGGAALHTMESGVADHLAYNETHAIQITRSII